MASTTDSFSVPLSCSGYSFSIYGIKITKEDTIKIAVHFDSEFEKGFGGLYSDARILVTRELSKMGLILKNKSNDIFWIGDYWSNIKDDQTGLEFKRQIEGLVVSIGMNKKCKSYNEIWIIQEDSCW